MKINDSVDFNLYRIFYFVAKTGSFSKTAEKLYVSQPSISYAIKNLEDMLETKLFHRLPKGVELTPAGKNLMFYVESAYNTLTLGQKMLNTDLNNSDVGELSIGVPSHIGIFFLSKYISNFHRRFPNIKIKIFSGSTSKLVEMMETHKVDFVVDAIPIIGKYKKIMVQSLKDFEYCFAVSKNYKDMDIKKNITVEELSNMPLMLPVKGNKNRNALDLYFSDKNISVNPIIEVSTTEMMINFTKRGMGIGYFIREAIQDNLENGSFIEINIKEDLPKERVAVAYIEETLTAISQKFLDLFVEYEINN